MNGRVEHDIAIKNNILLMLKSMPKCVEQYYYNIQTSKEPTTCMEYIKKINNLLLFCSKNDIYNVEDIDDVLIARYFEKINYTINGDGTIRKTSNSYKKATWSALNSFFTYLNKKRIINENPMLLIERCKKKDEIKRINVTMNDFNLILNEVLKYYNSNECNIDKDIDGKRVLSKNCYREQAVGVSLHNSVGCSAS